tara:strand:+ start:53 stop:1096 length:1044 start_codon:yes stop_codon:yes gene_type:complete
MEKNIQKICNRIINKASQKKNEFTLILLINLLLKKNLELEDYVFFSRKKKNFNYLKFLKEIDNQLDNFSHYKKYGDFVKFKPKKDGKEKIHKKIYNSVWKLYSYEEYKKERIPRYLKRIKINKIDKLIKNKYCIDFGCGHGNFLVACKKYGAKYGYGIDFGKQSINYANQIKKKLGYSNKQLKYEVSTVYKTKCKKNSFDFAIQNGVFHHLKNPLKAFKEVYRVLKPGGFFWSYTSGENKGVYLNYCDLCQEIMSKFDSQFVLSYLKSIGLSQNKVFDIYDIFYAKYERKNFNYYSKMLTKVGFTNFKLLKGGYATDFDANQNNSKDFNYKFGEGELRLLCQKKTNQ